MTIVLVVCIIVTWLRLEVGGQLPLLEFLRGAFFPRALVQGNFRVLATSTLLTRDLFMVVSISVSLLVALGTYEVLAGHLRAILMAVGAAVVGPVSVAMGLGLLNVAGITWAGSRLGTLDIGASAIVAGASGGVAGLVRDRRLTCGLVAFLLGGLALHHQLADWEHLLVFPWGVLAGRLGGGWHPPPQPTRRRSAAYLAVTACLLVAALPASYRLFPKPKVLRDASGAVLSPPRMIDTTYPAPSLGGLRRHVLVMLPAGYDSTHDRYPVVDLLHGYPGTPAGLFSSAGGMPSSATDAGIAPFIAIAPDANGPLRPESWDANIPGQQMGTATSIDLRRWATATFRTNGSWSYAGLSSGGYGAAYLPLIDPDPVHAVCGLSGYYDASRIPISAPLNSAARNQYRPIDHPDQAPPITFLAYGRSDPVTMRQTLAYAAALRKSHHTVVVRTYPGRHSWQVWRPAFADCFRVILPATPSAARPH